MSPPEESTHETRVGYGNRHQPGCMCDPCNDQTAATFHDHLGGLNAEDLDAVPVSTDVDTQDGMRLVETPFRDGLLYLPEGWTL